MNIDSLTLVSKITYLGVFFEFNLKSETVIGNKDWCSLWLGYWANFLLQFLICHSTRISFLKWGYRSLSEFFSVYTVLFYTWVYIKVLLVNGHNWIPTATSQASLFLFSSAWKDIILEGFNDRLMNIPLNMFRMLLVPGIHDTAVILYLKFCQ